MSTKYKFVKQFHKKEAAYIRGILKEKTLRLLAAEIENAVTAQFQDRT